VTEGRPRRARRIPPPTSRGFRNDRRRLGSTNSVTLRGVAFEKNLWPSGCTFWDLQSQGVDWGATRTPERCSRRGTCFGGSFTRVSRLTVIHRHASGLWSSGSVATSLTGCGGGGLPLESGDSSSAVLSCDGSGGLASKGEDMRSLGCARASMMSCRSRSGDAPVQRSAKYGTAPERVNGDLTNDEPADGQRPRGTAPKPQRCA